MAEDLAEGKKITAGLLLRQGILNLNDNALVAAVKERDDKKRLEAEKVRKWKRSELKQRIEKVRKLRAAKSSISTWNVEECKAFVQYKKRKDERGAMPTKISELRKRCEEFSHRHSPNVSPHPSDDEGEDDHDTKEGLLQLPDVLTVDGESSGETTMEMDVV